MFLSWVIRFSLALVFMRLLVVPASAYIADKTPSDVYAQTQILSALVERLRAKANVNEPWPEAPKQLGNAPRHVLQKALEVLNKINLLREIKGMGAVSAPPFPAREITPNEVFNMVKRLVGEVRLLATGAAQSLPLKYRGKTSTDVYRLLWSVSRALDPVLGVRGFTPSDVYAQSVHVVDLARFLRLTQNLPGQVKKPPRPSGKHPNHAIAAAYKVLARIAEAEINLWMVPVPVAKAPRPVVAPSQVYDAIQIVISEMQRIKFRLGVQRHFPIPAPVKGKTPDDVIQNLEWAARLMPAFDVNRPLYQYNPASLMRTPRDVFNVTEHILRELRLLKAARGNRVKPRVPPAVSELQPKHVYQKTLENLAKTNLLRKQAGLGALVLPIQLLRGVTPDEVYDLAVRLDAELGIIYRKSNVSGTYLASEEIIEVSDEEKTSSDVYFNMWRISYLLDAILGSKGSSPTDVYWKSQEIVAELKLISQRLGRYKERLSPPLVSGKAPKDVIVNAIDVLAHIKLIQRRAGIYVKQPPAPQHEGEATPNDVYNLMVIINAELIALKAHLGLDKVIAPIKKTSSKKSPSHVFQALNIAHMLLADILLFERQDAEQP